MRILVKKRIFLTWKIYETRNGENGFERKTRRLVDMAICSFRNGMARWLGFRAVGTNNKLRKRCGLFTVG